MFNTNKALGDRCFNAEGMTLVHAEGMTLVHAEGMTLVLYSALLILNKQKQQPRRQTARQAELAKLGQCCVVSQLATPDELTLTNCLNLRHFTQSTTNNCLNLRHLGDLMPNRFILIHLWFKALFLSSDYRLSFSTTDSTDITRLQSKYPNINKTRHAFGDVYLHDDIDVAFGMWLQTNQHLLSQEHFIRYEVINAGEDIKPEAGVIYYTVTSQADIKQVKQVYKDLFTKHLSKLQDEMDKKRFTNTDKKKDRQEVSINGIELSLYKTGFNKEDKLLINSKRLSAISAYQRYNLDANEKCLNKRYSALEFALYQDDSTSYIDDIWLDELVKLNATGGGSLTAEEQRVKLKLDTIDMTDQDITNAILMAFKKLVIEGESLIHHAVNFTFPNFKKYK